MASSSDVKVSSASPMMWRSSDSSREESHELCPDGLALKKRLISAGQAEPDALQNGSPVRSDDTPVLHGNIERKSGSAFTSTVLHSGSPQLVRANGMLRSTDRRIICQCGVCKLCLRPSSANAASHCEESMDSSFGDDAPLNLTVSSSRAALSSSQWRNETNNSVPRYSRQMVITAGIVFMLMLLCELTAGAY